ncbi:MAG: biopolymer transporter ExbD [Gammaproteobacteria bacterium]|nr:biopolymer transporter ExbD [Gammaproteobacteria bacterium]
MKETRRTIRMERHHKRRSDRSASLNMVSLMDIFTILVFFLLVSAADSEVLPSPKAIKLPESTTDKRPKENIIIMVNNSDLLLQGKFIADTRQVMKNQKPVIADLIQQLIILDEESRKIKGEKPASKRGVTIMGDKQLHYQLLKKIMLSCATAKYSNISLAVMQKTPEQ